MSAITMIIMETEASGTPPGPLSYTLAPTAINYGFDRCRGRLFRDEDYDSRWSPPVGRESQCPGRVDEDSLCSRCLHNKARWRESCGTATIRGGNQDWWGRVDDPMPARAPTLAGKGWAAEKKPVWRAVSAPAAAAAAAETVESLTTTLAALTAEYMQISYDYDCLTEDEDEWPEESDDLNEQFQTEHAELRRLNKVIKEGGILPPAATAPTAAETVDSLRVKIADMRNRRDNIKQHLDSLLADGWVISTAVKKAFADVREKIAVAREHLALRTENAALKNRVGALEEAAAAALQVGTASTAEIGALRARITALEEELADADNLSKSLTEQLAGEVARADEADFHLCAFEEATGRLRSDMERVSISKAEVQRRCDEQAETIATMGQTIEGLRQGLDETAAAKLRFSDDFAAALQRAEAAEADAAKYRELFNHLNNSVWAYGGTISSLRRRIEASEPLRRIAELEEQVAALREKNAEVTRRLYFEVGHAIKWQDRAYAAEKPAVGATEVHDLREQLVVQKDLVRERDEARAEIEALKAAAAEDRENMVHWMARGEAAEKMLKEQREALDHLAVQHGEMTHEIEHLRAEVATLRADKSTLLMDVTTWRQRAERADHEADEAHEESADFQRALAHEGDREEALEAERDRWQERYRDLRRLITETLTEVETILEREQTMATGRAMRALSLLK